MLKHGDLVSFSVKLFNDFPVVVSIMQHKHWGHVPLQERADTVSKKT